MQALRALAASLVEIHGQHDERALTDAATHRALVDAYGGLEAQARATRAAPTRRCATPSGRWTPSGPASPPREAEADFARHAHEELAKLAVRPGEEEELAEPPAGDDAGREGRRRHPRGARSL